MKFSCVQENLNKGLLVVSHIATKNTTLPILNNVLVEVKEKEIRLSTTNLEIGINCMVRGKIEKEGSYTFPAKLLSDYINLLPNKKIDIELQEERLGVSCENYKTKLNGQPAADFPLIPRVEKDDAFVCQAESFKRALQQVIFACTISENRPDISGVLLSFTDDGLTMAATDSYRLAERKIKFAKKGKKELKVIVPARTLNELVRILSTHQGVGELTEEEDGESLKIYINENQILFLYDNIELVSRVIEGQYPDYQQIIPQNNKTEATVSVAEFVKAVKLGSLFTKTGINDIDLNFKDKELLVSSANTQAGENKINLNIEKSGDDNNIVVNYRYLLDGLQNIDADEVCFNMIDGSTPCSLRPKGENKDSYLYIIMPIRQ